MDSVIKHQIIFHIMDSVMIIHTPPKMIYSNKTPKHFPYNRFSNDKLFFCRETITKLKIEGAI